jgi:EAL domain-containing protein (putative c-di-GMP-specific phosphodiesterase class I)
MASELNLDVVAEGVERKEQIEALSSIGCELMQGYYYGKPMERPDMEAWLKEHSQAG